jgi:galactose mutarotase-like enzyme
MTALTLRSAHASVVLDPDRGGELQSFTAGDSANLLFHADWRSPLSADDGPVYGSTELDWLSRYQGGWQVLFPNAGAEGVVDGVPVAFHGEASLARLEMLGADETSCRLRAVARLPLELVRTVRMAPDRPAVLLEETVTNVGSRPVPFLWGHHPTFPAQPGARIDLAGATVEVEPATPGRLAAGGGEWPVVPGASGAPADLSIVPAEEQVRLTYLHGLREPWVALRPPAGSDDGGPGVALRWDGDTFPALWIWLQNRDPGFPWYGRSRMIGLEPQRSWPFDGLAGAIGRGQELVLAPGESRSSWVTLAAFDDTDRPVTGLSRAGAVTQAAPITPG